VGPIEYRYVDIIWLDNLVMNFILLWTTSKLSKECIVLWRLWLASCIGASYAVVMIYYKSSILNCLGLKILLSLAMLIVVFKYTSIAKLLRLMGLFYSVTFAFGGGVFGIYFFTQDILSIENGVFYIKNFPVKVLFFSALLIIIFIYTLVPRIRRIWTTSHLVYPIKIIYNGMDFILDALLDTGNSLYDPMTHSPVVIVEYTKIQELLPNEIRDIFKADKDSNMEYIANTLSDSDFIGRFRLIPYHTVGKPGGLLLGFRPDKVLISVEDKWSEYEDIIVALYNDRLSRDEQYHALIHPEVLST